VEVGRPVTAGQFSECGRVDHLLRHFVSTKLIRLLPEELSSGLEAGGIELREALVSGVVVLGDDDTRSSAGAAELMAFFDQSAV
jgi:hypothetical protein